MADEVTVSIDPHVHSEGSYDGHEPVELLLEQASEIGLDGIVVTDHDRIDESLRAAELAADYGLVGIPGVEVSTAAGHLLAIGVEERPEPHRSFAETVTEVRDLGGAAVVPHPFQRTRHGVRKRRLTDCDAVEVYNSWVFTGYQNRRAKRFARNRDYPGVAASDAHSAMFLGRAYTDLTVPAADSKATLDGNDVVRALRAGSASIHGRRQPLVRSARHYLAGAGRKAGWAVRRHTPTLR
ncbi:CehA/McbA family metallohydrolase [Candidatus Halobonum tyrrellensis]|uniref:PHP domain-containing protein n=1 Tax=Candidatus Halobonum tyrrellensis G22 TaxID=1324957 RepID=V4HBA8_9EURY|nr:PHP domain-containing protein [Candidatus Halobonum tyrrellensis]ESP87308.1 PHP domain-containing protein [Candidatus Halobonum tyrrellensis G22]